MSSFTFRSDVMVSKEHLEKRLSMLENVVKKQTGRDVTVVIKGENEEPEIFETETGKRLDRLPNFNLPVDIEIRIGDWIDG